MTHDELIDAIRNAPMSTLPQLVSLIGAVETRAVEFQKQAWELDLSECTAALTDAFSYAERAPLVERDQEERRQDWVTDEAKALRKGE